jgi:hypothetical protein
MSCAMKNISRGYGRVLSNFFRVHNEVYLVDPDLTYFQFDLERKVQGQV